MMKGRISIDTVGKQWRKQWAYEIALKVCALNAMNLFLFHEKLKQTK